MRPAQPDDAAAAPRLQISRYNRAADARPREMTLSWPELADRLTRFDLRPSKDGPAWSPCRFRPGCTRADQHVLDVCALVLDFDDGVRPEELQPRWEGLEYVIHSTYHHRREKRHADRAEPARWRWRAVFPLACPAPAAGWSDHYQRLATALAGDHWDRTCRNPSRLYYWPAAPDAEHTFAARHAGERLGVSGSRFQVSGPDGCGGSQPETSNLKPETLLRRMRASAAGARIDALLRGDTSAYGGDHSRADMALCDHLAFWTGGDAAAMDALFRQSGLYRPKWDEPHYAGGETYGAHTLARALGRVGPPSPPNPGGAGTTLTGEGEAEGSDGSPPHPVTPSPPHPLTPSPPHPVSPPRPRRPRAW